jgi:hypothetical protein
MPAPAPQPALIQPALPPQEKKPEKKTKEKKPREQKENSQPKRPSRVPPPLMPGCNYMYPLEHTRIHIFRGARKVWEPKYQGKQ